MAAFTLGDYDEARTQLTYEFPAIGIPRLDAEDIPTAIRPNIPLYQPTGGGLSACSLSCIGALHDP